MAVHAGVHGSREELVSDFPKTTEQMVADIEALAIAVIGDMPKASLHQQLMEAMKRTRGSMNPRLVRNAIEHFRRGC